MLKSSGKKPQTYVGYTKDLKKESSNIIVEKEQNFTRGRKWSLIYKEKLDQKVEQFLENII